MASSRALLALLLLVLALHLVHSGDVVAGETQPVMSGGSRSLAATAAVNQVNCPAACAVRCSRSWKPKMCLRMCGVCCSRCNCVPSGTGVETRAECPCYANMRNPKGKLKCP